MAHYELEKRLAARIMNARPEERSAVSLEAYDELFRTITWHEGHLATPEQQEKLKETYAPFARLVGQGHDVLEVGCGNGAQLKDLAAVNNRCVGIDISAEVLDHQAAMPENVDLLLADAIDLTALPADDFDVAFSSQLIEHLHPDDLPTHFAQVARVLRKGGRYVLETPHRLTGPHDVSRHFDDVATCFHLREYFVGELLAIMRAAGFVRFRSPLFRHAMYERRPRLARCGEIPADLKRPFEAMVQHLPPGLRRRAARVLRLDTILLEAWF
jgi:SAM-dependent methyltransferase